MYGGKGSAERGVDGAADLLGVANNPKYAETGGGHGAKGVDFPRWWAVLRLLELEKANEPDFLLLFESVQDVGELDSSTNPTRVRVYQVKKKDAGTWTWSVLTGTVAPRVASVAPKKRVSTAKPRMASFKKVQDSALGKLYLSLGAFNSLQVEGVFLSNAGCDFPLAGGGSAATSTPCSLAELSPDHAQLLTDALASLAPSGPPPDLTQIKLKKVAIHPDELTSPAVAAALDLLNQRSPEHASQARAFVDSLFMKLSTLTRRTDACLSFEQLVEERGFSRASLRMSLETLEVVPDRLALLDLWLQQLQSEGWTVLTVTHVRLAASRAQQDRLAGGNHLSLAIDAFSDAWMESNPVTPNLRPYVEAALEALRPRFSELRDYELMARFVMRAITKCADPN